MEETGGRGSQPSRSARDSLGVMNMHGKVILLGFVGGLLSVVLLWFVKPRTNDILNELLASTIVHPGLRYAAVAGPLAEEGVKGLVALLIVAAAWRSGFRATGASLLSLPVLHVVAFGSGFALLETLTNQDGGWTWIFIRAVLHSTYVGCTVAGLYGALLLNRRWLGVGGLLIAIVLHGFSNGLTELGFDDLKESFFVLCFGGLVGAAVHFRGVSNVWPPVGLQQGRN